MRIVLQSSILVMALVATAPLQAEDWKHEIAPYLWGSGLDGTTGAGPVTVDVDADFGDILDHLELGFMGMYRASRDRLSITVDGIYSQLESDGTGPIELVRGEVELEQTLLEVDVGYAVTEHLVMFGGLRYNDVTTKVSATGPLGNTLSGEIDEDWTDPVIGARYTWPFSEQWSVTLRGDIGGFGVGSDFAWQGAATLRWQSSPRFGVLAAYRYIYADFEDGSGSDFFKYDMAMHGPALGVVFSF